MGEGADGASHGAMVASSGASNVEVDKETFLTSLRGTENTTINMAAMEARQALVASVSGMGRVEELHHQLSHVVGSLSEKVSDVLKKQETEFLSAYRAHMYNVQKELQELRTKVQNAELELQRDEKIKQLTQERDWFRKEALRLDAYATSMKKEIKFMEEKLESVDEDRSWLENQLKSAKKQNKLLRTELEMHLGPEASVGGPRSSIQILALESGIPSNNQASQLAPPIRNSHSQNQLGMNSGLDSHKHFPSKSSALSKSSVGFYNTPSYERSGSQKSLFEGDQQPQLYEAPMMLMNTAHDEQAASAKRTMRQLREQVQREKEQVRELRAQIVVERTERSNLQDLFSQCVEDVKKDILRRKERAKRAQSKKMGGEVRSEQSIQLEDREARIIQFDNFTSLDRRRVLERLLEQEEVYQLLQDRLFPSCASPTSPSLLSKSPKQQQEQVERRIAQHESKISEQKEAAAAAASKTASSKQARTDFGLSLLLESI